MMLEESCVFKLLKEVMENLLIRNETNVTGRK